MLSFLVLIDVYLIISFGLMNSCFSSSSSFYVALLS